jgi:LacI family repressor for deo operon, udp, cdd, tsx, nupC, and nupG
MATIKDVAKMAHVSISTVSRVINNPSTVSADKQKKVLEVIEKLNYQPNLLGRSLRSNESKMVSIVLPGYLNELLGEVFRGLSQSAENEGYDITITPTYYKKDREKRLIYSLTKRHIDGVILITSLLNSNEILELSQTLPVVQCLEYKDIKGIGHVSIDDEKAAFDATNHLIDLGHQRIGMISSNLFFNCFNLREIGFRKALEQSNMNFDSNLIYKTSIFDIETSKNKEYQGGIVAAKHFLKMKERPSAIICISDTVAAGCIDYIKESGLNVPKDIAVIGFDDTKTALMCTPKLTTITQPAFELGYEAMQILISQITGKSKIGKRIMIDHDLTIRESTVGKL